MEPTDVDSDVTLNGPYNPIKYPGGNGETKGEKLEDEDPETAFVSKTKGKVFVEFPVKWNTMEGVGDVSSATPHGGCDSGRNSLNSLHFEFWDLNKLIQG